MRRERGAALLMAMLTVVLVASFAATALWQQWRGLQMEKAERDRVQASWVLVGALDWGRLILRESGRNGGPDNLTQPWSVPLQESRLSDFLAADKDNTVDNKLDVFLSGDIQDMQGRLNITSLVNQGQISAPDLAAFGRLFELLGLPQNELQAMAVNLRNASDLSATNPAITTAPLVPQRVEQLTWLGLSPSTIESLSPYISILPVRTPVNLNTASANVLYACIPGIEMAQAQQLVNQRASHYFQTINDALTANAANNPKLPTPLTQYYSVTTQFFEVRGRLRMEHTVVEEHSLVQRNGLLVQTVWRERAALPSIASQNSANGQSLQ